MIVDKNAVSMLKIERIKRGLSQAELARATGANAPSISRIENRMLCVTNNQAEILSEFFGIPPECLFDENGLAKELYQPSLNSCID